MALTFDDVFRLERSKKIMILLGIAVLITGGYFFSIFHPKYLEYEADKETLMDLQQKKVEQEIIAQNLPKFREQVAQLDVDLKKALTQLPNKREISSLLTSISNVGRESGLEFLLFRPQPENLKEFYAEVPIELKIVGTYHQVATFFDKVARLPRIVKISDITIGEPKDLDRKISLTTSCIAMTYRFVEGVDEEEE